MLQRVGYNNRIYISFQKLKFVTMMKRKLSKYISAFIKNDMFIFVLGTGNVCVYLGFPPGWTRLPEI